ncbi:uncharacterized protein YALI1_C03197g [Yarrowia lipolytica]|uniref:Uncharacterized protein n=1 Tax=Yarrowia lipolytica TaxID=4952 RepID=A0A1D8N9B0_YARLL|nr:hypothetical protein YALI1_C03197g [Yarrowia lipolytica]
MVLEGPRIDLQNGKNEKRAWQKSHNLWIGFRYGRYGLVSICLGGCGTYHTSSGSLCWLGLSPRRGFSEFVETALNPRFACPTPAKSKTRRTLQLDP